VPVRDKRVCSTWAFATLDDVVVLCARAESEPTERDVAAWVEYLRRTPCRKLLIQALGSAPDSAQRGRIAGVYGDGRPSPQVLVMTNSRAVRFVSQAFRWLVKHDIHAVAPEQLTEGLDWLEFAGSRVEMARLIAELHADLGTVVEAPSRASIAG